MNFLCTRKRNYVSTSEATQDGKKSPDTPPAKFVDPLFMMIKNFGSTCTIIIYIAGFALELIETPNINFTKAIHNWLDIMKKPISLVVIQFAWERDTLFLRVKLNCKNTWYVFFFRI